MTTHIYKVINDVSSIVNNNKVKVTSSDLNESYLDDKIVVGSTKLTKTVLNGGGDEDLQLDVDETKIDHGNLLPSSLSDDDHTQYALLAGRATGQVIIGGTASGDDLTLRSTSNATKGSVIIDETTESTDKDSGALVIEGGVGIEKNLNVGGNLHITGNITIDGDTSQFNVTTLEIEDANITVNNGGNDASAEGAGLTIERTGTNGSLVYEDALASKFKLGAAGSEIEITNVSSSQTLTNKTIDADNNTISNLAHGSEVDNPSSGVHGVTGSVVGTSDTQPLTNKTLDNTNTVTLLDTGFTLQDNIDNTKQATFQLSGITTATTRTLTLPDEDDTLVVLDGTQTLTNKTLTSPVINTSISGTAILDEDDMVSNSDTQIPTQQSVKAYVDSFNSAGDLVETSFSITNNQSTLANITGFAFANGTVRGFKAEVTIEINADSDLFEKVEMEGIQKATDWIISYSSTGDDSGILFDITTAGQLQYTSPNFTGFVSGDIKFRAVTLSI